MESKVITSPIDMAARTKLGLRSGDTVRVHVRVREGEKERIQVYQGVVVGRKSEFSLYNKHLATYDTADQFDHDAAKGFIRLWGLGQQTQLVRVAQLEVQVSTGSELLTIGVV